MYITHTPQSFDYITISYYFIYVILQYFIYVYNNNNFTVAYKIKVTKLK